MNDEQQADILLTRPSANGGPDARALCEGPSAWADADATLRRWALTAPASGLPEPVLYGVVFANGFSADGVYPLRRHDTILANLARVLARALRSGALGVADSEGESRSPLPDRDARDGRLRETTPEPGRSDAGGGEREPTMRRSGLRLVPTP